MTTSEVLARADEAGIVKRRRNHARICCAKGGCRKEVLANEPLRWTWCADCLTVYDVYDRALNPVSKISGADRHKAKTLSIRFDESSARRS
jgi:hypothetical protein